MSSENSPTSPRGNVVCIPTICLDSLNDSCSSSDQFCVTSESESEQSFGTNVYNFFSWLSLCGSQRRFLVAAVLSSSCEPGFRHALQSLSMSSRDNDADDNKEAMYFKANDCEYLSRLKSMDPVPANLTSHLLELLQYVSFPSNNTFSSLSSRRISTASTIDHTKEHDTSSTSKSASHLQLSNNSDKNQSLKKLYLNLIAECISQECDLINLSSRQSLPTLSDSAIKELVMQQPLSQLLLRVFLHPAFNREDRNWLCSLVRAQQQSSNLEPVHGQNEASTNGLSDAQAFSSIQLKSLDCLLEALVDLSIIMHFSSLNSAGSVHFASSLSHSLTSSGFLSGCVGSGSQFDLLSEGTNGNSSYANPNGTSQYGTLLTVPTPDPRAPSHHLVCSAYPGLMGALEHRRLSDGPYILSQSLASSTVGQETRVAATRMNSRNNHAHVPYTTVDYVSNTNPQIKSHALARASLPNALAAQYPVDTITEHTSDSVSLSSASSAFSSNLDLQPVCHHRYGISPPKSPSGSITAVTNDRDNYSLPPSPPSTVSAVSSAIQSVLISSAPTSSVPHPCLSRIPCSLAYANYSPDSRESCELANCDGVANRCSQNFKRDRNPTGFNPHDSSPESQAIYKTRALPEDLSSFSDPSSPMFAIPGWLKSLRLHKYAGLFQHLSYEEFMGITESWLEERNVTQGARTKLLLNIRKLAGRSSLLHQVETNLLQAPSAGLASLSALRTCLTEICNILHTPMGLASSPVTQCDPSLIPKSRNASDPSTTLHEQAQSESTNLVGTQVTSTEASCDSQFGNGGDSYSKRALPKEDTDCLPNQIMSCLTKVCSRLLVSSQPDLDCCERFIQLLDIIGAHPSFLDKQKSLTASWRQQMFNLMDSLPFHVNSDVPRSSRSIPRSYHGGRPFKKPAFVHSSHRLHALSKKEPTTCCSALAMRDAIPLVSTPYCDLPCTTSSGITSMDQGSVVPKLGPPNHQPQGYIVTNPTYNPMCSLDDNSHRRHSVPVNQVRPGPQPIKCCQGRRMPSPNPAFMPSRNTQFFFPGPLASSSDAEISQSAGLQLSHTRFHSPSSPYEGCYPSGGPRSLIPPATAPPTRMPSPSDLRQHNTGLPALSQELTSSVRLGLSAGHCQAMLTCPCTTPCGPSSKVDETGRTTAPLVQQTSPGTVPFHPNLRPDLHQQSHSFFSRHQIVSDASTALDCTADSSGFCDPCSFHTPSKNHLPTAGVNTVTGQVFESCQAGHQSMPGVPLTHDNVPFCSMSHDSHKINPVGMAPLGGSYHYPVQVPKSTCPCFILHPSGMVDGFGPSVTRPITEDVEWCTSNAGQLLQLPSHYGSSSDPIQNEASIMTTITSASGADTGTEFIEHNLDLLTRKVTELAIGEFDSPGE